MTPTAPPSRADWLALYQRAADQPHASGYYNKNIVSTIGDRRVIVRIPIPGAADMDMRILPEGDVLRLVNDAGLPAPRILHESRSPAFAVHEYIPGDLVDAHWPRGSQLPDHVIADLVGAISRLQTIGRDQLGTLPAAWPIDGDSAQIAALLLQHTQGIFDRAQAEYASIYNALGVPDDPLDSIGRQLGGLKPRPFRLVHADIHRKNLIVGGGTTWILDWELALWGDPLYEVAVHLHKMHYSPEERTTFLNALGGSPGFEWLSGSKDDLELMLMLERAKSVIVDTVRYAAEVQSGTAAEARTTALCTSLASKLNNVAPLWRNPVLTPEQVSQIISRRAA